MIPVSLIREVHLDLRMSPLLFGKIRNDPNVIFRGLEEDDSRKKPEAKNLVTCPFKRFCGDLTRRVPYVGQGPTVVDYYPQFSCNLDFTLLYLP
jgi:hypothetical protein